MPDEPKEPRKLTPKQERFCQEYVKDLNGTQAAIRASYSEDTAQEQSSRLLSNDIISERVEALQEIIRKRNEVTADWVVASLREVAERCLQAEPVKVLGVPTGEWVFNAPGANKALELLGKTMALFEENVNHKGSIELVHAESDANVLDRFWQSKSKDKPATMQ